MDGKKFNKGNLIADDYGKISYIGEEMNQKLPYHTVVVDCEGLTVIPGLIEAHCHVGISEEKKGIEGNDCNESTNPITPQMRAIDAVNPMDSAFHNAIAAGITSVMVGPGSSNVVGGQFLFMKTYGRCIDNMAVLSPAALKVAFGENPKTSYGDNGNTPSTRMGIAAMLRENLVKATQYMQNKQAALDNGDAFEKDFMMECYLPVLNGDIPLKAHVHRADDILTAIRIANEFNLNMTLDHCTEGHLIPNEIAQSGFPAIIGPSLASRNKIEVQNLDFKTAGVLNEYGVKIAITTDHPVSRIQYLPLCAALAAKEGLPKDEALKAITINAAQICNVADRVGSLEVGKDADIAIFDGNPLDVFSKIMYTIINGKIVFQKNEH